MDYTVVLTLPNGDMSIRQVVAEDYWEAARNVLSQVDDVTWFAVIKSGDPWLAGHANSL